MKINSGPILNLGKSINIFYKFWKICLKNTWWDNRPLLSTNRFEKFLLFCYLGLHLCYNSLLQQDSHYIGLMLQPNAHILSGVEYYQNWRHHSWKLFYFSNLKIFCEKEQILIAFSIKFSIFMHYLIFLLAKMTVLAKNDRYGVETTVQESINSKNMVKGNYLEFYG